MMRVQAGVRVKSLVRAAVTMAILGNLFLRKERRTNDDISLIFSPEFINM